MSAKTVFTMGDDGSGKGSLGRIVTLVDNSNIKDAVEGANTEVVDFTRLVEDWGDLPTLSTGIKPAVALQLVLVDQQPQQEEDGNYTFSFTWRPALTPATPSGVGRYFAEKNNRTLMGIGDVPIPMSMDLSMQVGPAVMNFCHDLSKLLPPTLAYVTLVYAKDSNLEPRIKGVASTARLTQIQRGAAKRHNRRAWERWQAEHFFGSLGRLLVGDKFIINAGGGPKELMPVPELPETDLWGPGGRDRADIERVITNASPVMDILWRAIFGEERGLRRELTEHGYNFSKMRRTIFDSGRINGATILGMEAPEFPPDLPDDAIRRLTMHDG